jgi:hypothetical protein
MSGGNLEGAIVALRDGNNRKEQVLDSLKGRGFLTTEETSIGEPVEFKLDRETYAG